MDRYLRFRFGSYRPFVIPVARKNATSRLACEASIYFGSSNDTPLRKVFRGRKRAIMPNVLDIVLEAVSDAGRRLVKVT
jgi:hypothetical protein